MRISNYLLLFILLVICTKVTGQLAFQMHTGIENPYKYEYTYNVTPNGPVSFESQRFRFFRTKIISAGVISDYTPPIMWNRLTLNIGANVGFMNQFVADTIANPQFDMLLYNAIHRNIFFTPEIGVTIKLYKFISATTGLEQFIPIRKWIDSDQGSEVFPQKYSREFYNTKTYYSFGLEFDLGNVKLGCKLQGGTEVDHWAKNFFIDIFINHDPQRWIINIKHDL